jgi:para-nitrobenzyl esterase
MKDEATSPSAASGRREFLQGLGVAIAAVPAAMIAKEASAQTPPSEPAREVRGGLNTPTQGAIFFTAETAYGKVQGIDNAGIKIFKGIPYGAPTGDKNRFMPPKKPTPWKGVKECIGYGPVCPQTQADLRSDYAQLIMWDRHVGDGPMGEDCLVLNVWTPGVDQEKRAVLVSFHGGGFATGSGNFPGYDGAQLARFGDVVVVTINHRLAAYGYTHLADLGAPPEFASAGVCGVMDMTASLEWVRDNIAHFGGDPSRVMIFGQSGGGAKTTTMLAVPAAKGLFHRAAIQSGSLLRFTPKDRASESAEKLLAKLGIPKTRIADIQKVSWQQLLEAQTAAMADRAAFAPVLDGKYLPHDAFDPTAPAESANVPIIVSTTLEDAALSLTNFDLDDAGLTKVLNDRFGGKGAEIVDMYRNFYPNKAPFLIQAQAFTDAGGRRNATLQVELKHKQGSAPAYLYLWAWATGGFDGKFGAVHGIDVSASFYNVRDQTVNVGSATGKAMCERLASAWVAFAKTGDPNNPKLPHWEPYNADTRPTMVFDNHTALMHDPRSDIRKFWASMPPMGPPAPARA